ncbi:nickel pincer cofactor biosynthesis protein LarB [Streptomyces galbus]|uniref:Nickel pincer cofactor biosynthesis protein LarB n=1 Tax=Streptomyces galbus TaxID=33898 RepID=A0A4U5X3U8_STRGB|nr:nickel pincer cofactor biosynthesis protein LarB [Streptomyces galbus]TKT08026.1 nickel pincer cofactor biosynthesis protein LarB [Streptomyces galbus]GHD42306.1 1-(5-phosphoribosyl)-5-amino-4-imidazole-carboxylate carboxylase [Streptomyces galbus]
MTNIVNLGFAQLDIGREHRQGVPEVVYGPGKDISHLREIVSRLLACNSGVVMVTRLDPDSAAEVLHSVPGGTYHRDGRLLVYRPAPPGAFHVAVVSAGTSDYAVASEAEAVCTAMGMNTTAIHDAGVAGLDRILAATDQLREADTVIVIAGMEGALASVVGGLVARPVIAVPTSTGYGASLDGVTALLAMHASCAAGVTVVNIDSGFGAAMAAHRLNQAFTHHQRAGAALHRNGPAR